MAPKTFLRTAVAAALLATGLAAQAGTMTYIGPAHNNFNDVSVVTPLAYRGGSAGGFSVSLSGFSELSGAFEAYCVDVSEYIGSSPDYSLFAAADYFTDQTKVTALGKLISYVYGGSVFANAVDKDAQSTALQLAIWNIVYDGDSANPNALTQGLFSGGFRAGVTTSGSYMNAQTLLTNSDSASAGAYDLYVLASGRPLNLSGNKQDQLIWKEAPSRRDLPEPASLALVALALGGAGLASRRRRA